MRCNVYVTLHQRRASGGKDLFFLGAWTTGIRILASQVARMRIYLRSAAANFHFQFMKLIVQLLSRSISQGVITIAADQYLIQPRFKIISVDYRDAPGVGSNGA